MWVLDASVLITLGRQDALDLLDTDTHVRAESPAADVVEHARTLLNDEHVTGDAAIIASVMVAAEGDGDIGVISDDQRIRRIAAGLGAEVTGTTGVIVEAVRQEQFAPVGAKQLVRDIDRQGFLMTGDLREAADTFIDQAAG